jgi:uncharacterized protein YdeI (YjbR/CyaY-like superfamily)
MKKMNPQIDHYLSHGCGRCPLGGKPECKVHDWTKELKLLRKLVLDCGLTEELKWGVPCYTYEQKNVAVVSAFKDYCSLSFFKGVLLTDPHQILDKPGENSQSVRLIRFTSVAEIRAVETALKAYVLEAIDLEVTGLKVEFKAKSELVLPEELLAKFEETPNLQAAFAALTPGRQRGYVLHFSAAKQSQTRTSRIEKCIQRIFEGRGFND